MEKVHHGLVIERVVRRSGMSISDIARILKINRRSVYNYFSQPRLSIDVVNSFGKVLGYDFSKDIPEYTEFRINTLTEPLDDPAQVEFWKQKYLLLLEKYNHMLLAQLEDVA